MVLSSGGTAVGSEAEILAQINLPDVFIINDFVRTTSRKDAALVEDVGVIADTQRFANVVVGDQHADAALLEKADDLLDIEHGDRIDAGERLVEQDETRIGRQRAGDLDPPPFAAGKRGGGTVAEVADVQFFEQFFGALRSRRLAGAAVRARP
jgi:hypothetical protein